MSYCPRCGVNVAEGVNFCPGCGARVGTGPIKCSNCGAQITVGASFCAGCGANVSLPPKVVEEKAKIEKEEIKDLWEKKAEIEETRHQELMSVLGIMVGFAIMAVGGWMLTVTRTEFFVTYHPYTTAGIGPLVIGFGLCLYCAGWGIYYEYKRKKLMRTSRS